jgi:hypothetical protein
MGVRFAELIEKVAYQYGWLVKLLCEDLNMKNNV